MIEPLHVLTLSCIVIFITAVLVRFIRTARMPVHLRWEIYPVAHDKGFEHGGSYMENQDWRNRPQEHSQLNKLKEFLTEFLFLKALFHHNRKLWWSSFPFHFGLYIIAAFAGLLVITALSSVFNVKHGGVFLSYLVQFTGIAGAILCLFGSAGLFFRRLFDKGLKKYSPISAYFNLLLFVGISVLMLTVGFSSSGFGPMSAYIVSFLTWSAHPEMPGPSKALLILSLLVLAYIPLTHMSHFFMKWFTWDKIRWDDEPNLPGSKLEKRIQAALAYPVSWSAPHIKGDGKKSWVDVATEEIEK
ncbi:MAG: hypothetical protein GXP49_13930 [Deltaproteobacteria bacterium]|nr:hypothetical protein [Deltaproteobacteria bacterium]